MTVEQSPAADEGAPEPVNPEIHHDHRDVSGGWLRPAVFGAMDGLVSNLSLISGVAGGHVAPHTVALTGLAGLVAGAFSMAVGEYTSVASQTELTLAEIEVEKQEIAARPHAEERELALLFQRRGVSPGLAADVARELSEDREQAWRIHAREELGVDPDDLPSPYVAAFSSLICFSVGAAVPLLPYVFGAHTLLISLVVSIVGLFALGAVVGRLTSRSWLRSGARQLLLGVVAAAVTYGIGRAVGAGVS